MRGSKSTTTHTYNSRCPLSNRRPDESSSQKITGKPNRQNRYHTYHHIDSTAPPPSCAPAQAFTFRSNSKGKRKEEKAARSGRGGGGNRRRERQKKTHLVHGVKELGDERIPQEQRVVRQQEAQHRDRQVEIHLVRTKTRQKALSCFQSGLRVLPVSCGGRSYFYLWFTSWLYFQNSCVTQLSGPAVCFRCLFVHAFVK